MNKTLIIVIVVILAVLGGIYVFFGATRTQIEVTSGRDRTINTQESTGSSVTDTPVSEITIPGYQGKVLAGNLPYVFDFVKSDYEEALKSDRLIVLYFYANWCPICREEIPKFYGAFDELSKDFNKYGKVVGFRVNYNDNETGQDEVALAKEFGVAYQHTKVFLKNGQRVLKSPESWDKQRYLDEINKSL